MKKIKVYLQYPWKVSDSQYYKSLVENPPKNIIYLSSKEKVGMITSKNKLLIANFIKSTIRNITEKLNIIIPNTHKTITNESYDLIHCAHCLSLNNSPWVADFESLWQMWISGRDTKKGHQKVLKILKKKNCKKILAWTESTKKEIALKFPEIKDKIEMVSFALHLPKFKKSKDKKIRLLFIGRYFYEKGGLHVLEVFDTLTKKYKNVEAIFISQTPKRIKKDYSQNKKIKFYDLMPYEKIIKEIYPSSNILIYPGYSDTFGFIFTEALSFGIPVITVDGYARKEIIDDGKTGFIIERVKDHNWYPLKKEEEKIIKEITEKTSKLIKNKKLREKMSKNCREVIKKGRFSIKERNKKLREIYEEALKN